MGIKSAWNTFWGQADEIVAESRIGRFFSLAERNGKFSTEIRAGTVTFVTTAYILCVNAQLLSETGGSCSYRDCTGLIKGPNCVFPNEYGETDEGYQRCLDTVRRSLVTATAASSMVGCILMGLLGNMPLALAPGMGLNAYFAFNVVGFRGTGDLTYDQALAIVLMEGVVLAALGFLDWRQHLINWVPRSIMLATSGGIGLYLATIGLENNQGLGVIAFSKSTLTTLGGCPTSKMLPTYIIQPTDKTWYATDNGTIVRSLPLPSAVYACDGSEMLAGTVWLGIAGLVIICVLMSRSFKASIISGIVFVTLVAWIPNHSASYLMESSPIPGGQQRWDVFKHVVAKPNLKQTGIRFDFSGFRTANAWIAFLTFIYIDFLDTTGTLLSMSHFINNYAPGFLNSDRKFPRQRLAYAVDGLTTICGAMMGTSPVAVFIESASGIREGGRTGITALVTALYFAIALFFEPILASVPPYAVGPGLIAVGALMMINVVKIKWDAAVEALPAFLTIVVMPLTFSIAYGVIAGLVGFFMVHTINYVLDVLAQSFAWRCLRCFPCCRGNDADCNPCLGGSSTLDGDPGSGRRDPGESNPFDPSAFIRLVTRHPRTSSGMSTPPEGAAPARAPDLGEELLTLQPQGFLPRMRHFFSRLAPPGDRSAVNSPQISMHGERPQLQMTRPGSPKLPFTSNGLAAHKGPASVQNGFDTSRSSSATGQNGSATPQKVSASGVSSSAIQGTRTGPAPRELPALPRPSPFLFDMIAPSSSPPETPTGQGKGLSRASRSSGSGTSLAEIGPATDVASTRKSESPRGPRPSTGGARGPPASPAPHPLGAPPPAVRTPAAPPVLRPGNPSGPYSASPGGQPLTGSTSSRRKSIVNLIQDWDSLTKECDEPPLSSRRRGPRLGSLSVDAETHVAPSVVVRGRGRSVDAEIHVTPGDVGQGRGRDIEELGPGRLIPITAVPRTSRGAPRDIERRSIERSTSLPGLPVLGRGGIGAGQGEPEGRPPDIEEGGSRGGKA